MPRGVGIVGHVAETGQMLFVPDAQSDHRFDPNVDQRTGFSTRSLVCVPLTIRDRVVGVIEVVNVADVHHFQTEEAPFLRILADYGAIAIENSQYVSRIEQLTLTDEYTGLRNARYLHDALDGLIEDARATGAPLSVAFADLDNFKRIVDTYGHLMGSQVLREVGNVMSEALDASDTLVKYGGDEFVVLMPGKGTADARNELDRVRRAVADAQFLQTDPTPVHVTASFGVATFPRDAATKKNLLLRADNAMYEAKRVKNAVAVA
jgi:diguanylate cyclase (GGDEF)-like protein